jgi:hypothetical protein
MADNVTSEFVAGWGKIFSLACFHPSIAAASGIWHQIKYRLVK